jgi:quercetin dioxygenase-like cupin family protein
MSATVDNSVRIGPMELKFFGSGLPGDCLVAFEITLQPGMGGPEPHYHREVDEFVYGLEGTFTYSVDGQVTAVKPGVGAFSPRGSVHRFSNDDPSAIARALIVLGPGSIGKPFFSEVADVVRGGGPPDFAKVREIMLQHGLVPVPEPSPATS